MTILEKRLSVIDIVLNTANQIIKQSKIAYPKKRIFPTIDRRPKKRIDRSRAKTELMITTQLGAAQIQIILSQPTPKFKPEENLYIGSAIVNENGIEIIQTNNGTIPALSNQQATQPKRNCSNT